MMLLALAAMALAPNQYFSRMNIYLACLSERTPKALSERPLAERSRAYRMAAAQCVDERRAAIDAAVDGREPGVSEASARALAIDIIDTLNPMSSMPKR